MIRSRSTALVSSHDERYHALEELPRQKKVIHLPKATRSKGSDSRRSAKRSISPPTATSSASQNEIFSLQQLTPQGLPLCRLPTSPPLAFRCMENPALSSRVIHRGWSLDSLASLPDRTLAVRDARNTAFLRPPGFGAFAVGRFEPCEC